LGLFLRRPPPRVGNGRGRILREAKAMRNPNGFGTVIKLPGARRRPYAARVTVGRVDGKPKYKNIGYYTAHADATAALCEYHKNPFDFDAREITMGNLFEKWLKLNVSGNLSNSSISGLRGAFNRCAHIHHRPYVSIKAHDIRGAMDAPDIAPSMRQVIRNMFRHLDRYAYELEIIDRRCSDTITASAPPPKKEAHIFTASEVGRLWDNVGAPFVDVVLILLYSGWRIQELLNLKKSDIDLDAGTMRGGVKTAAGKGRIVPIHSAILPLIKNRVAADGGDYLLTHKGAQIKYNTFSAKWFRAAMKLIGAKHRIHETRHTFRTALDNASAPIACANKIMGHTCRDVGLSVYTHKTIDELRRVVELVDYSGAASIVAAPLQTSLFSAAV
jgi:integrase